jgi:hypothetical protein
MSKMYGSYAYCVVVIDSISPLTHGNIIFL